MNLEEAVRALEHEHGRVLQQLNAINQAIIALSVDRPRRGRRTIAEQRFAALAPRRKRHMSASARARIAAAQRARWAKWKKENR